jgi:hypothetical protein
MPDSTKEAIIIAVKMTSMISLKNHIKKIPIATKKNRIMVLVLILMEVGEFFSIQV